MALDPTLDSMLDAMRAADRPGFAAMTVEQARVGMPASRQPEVADVRDDEIPGPAGPIPVRVYRAAPDTTGPAAVYLHGGGFVIGDLDSHDTPCRQLANAMGATVVAVDYRRAPEHSFPAAPDDAYAALTWVLEHGAEWGIDTDAVGVIGDSAGGNLATVACLMARDRATPLPAYQILVYPNTDYDESWPSIGSRGTGYMVTYEDMKWFWGHYVEDPEHFQHHYMSPMKAESLAGMPPALVVTAEYDFLRDEGEAYARRLAEDGVLTTHSRYPTMAHGFIHMGALIAEANHLITEIADAARRLVALRAATAERATS
jgi:acetyl esterase